MGEWREFDTTADTGLEVWGSDAMDLFTTAGKVFTTMTTDFDSLEAEVTKVIDIDGTGLDIQFRDFLDELLFILETKDLLPIDFHSFEFFAHGMKCKGVFGKWVAGVHESRTEIKAVTYHMLKVKQLEDGIYYGRVVFDI